MGRSRIRALQRKAPTRKHIARAHRERRVRWWVLGATIFLVVVVLGLIGYGILDQTVITPQRPVAVIGQTEIPLVEFEKAVQYRRVRLLNEYRGYYQLMRYLGGQQQQYQARLDQIEAQLADPTGIGRTVLEDLVRQGLVRLEATRQGIMVSAAEVENEIQSFFGYDPNRMPPTPMPTALPDHEVTPTKGLPPTPFPTSTPYTEEAFRELYSEYLSELQTDTGMTEADIYRLFEGELLSEKIRDAVTEDVAMAEEHINARHILVSLDDHELAQNALGQALAGEDFIALAAEFSVDQTNADDGGALGWFPRGRMVPAFEEAVFAAEVGVIPALVETQFGYHILEVLGREVRPISETMVKQRHDEAYNDWMAGQRTSEAIELFDWWESRVPTEPTLEQYFRQPQ